MDPPNTQRSPVGDRPDNDAAWRAMADAVSVALVTLDHDRVVLQANRRACELMGATRDWDDLVLREPWKAAQQLCHLVASTGVDDFMEVRDPESGQMWEIAAHQRRDGPDGDRLVLVLQDTTERSQLEEKLRRQERLTALGTLVDGISHQVRSNLFGLTGLIDVIATQAGPDASLHAFLEMQRGQTQRIVDLLDRVLQYAGPTEPHRSPGDLAAVVEIALRETKELLPQRVEVVVELDDTLPPVVMDRDRLAVALGHLLRNAFEHSPEAGTVRLIGRLAPEATSPRVELVIEDGGRGIDPEDQARLFQPFFTRLPAGHGLGLPIARRIAEDHGGRLQIENRTDGGCRARLSLPVRTRPTEASDPPNRNSSTEARSGSTGGATP